MLLITSADKIHNFCQHETWTPEDPALLHFRCGCDWLNWKIWAYLVI